MILPQDLRINNIVEVSGLYPDKTIDYVHQLQNLFLR